MPYGYRRLRFFANDLVKSVRVESNRDTQSRGSSYLFGSKRRSCRGEGIRFEKEVECVWASVSWAIFHSSRHSPVAYARCAGCRSAVTLALLIACPTKVYHYHCRPLFPATAHRILSLSLYPSTTAHHSPHPTAPRRRRCRFPTYTPMALRYVEVKRWIPFGRRGGRPFSSPRVF